MQALRVGFAGTPVFARAALAAILAAGFPVPLVLTQPDRPQGRGLAVLPLPVKALALAHGIRVLQPASFQTDAVQAEVAAFALDVLVVAAYGLILPPAVLAWPRHGALNIHASLLPRWRGAAPIQRAILAGDTTTGVTIVQMDTGLDTGPMIDAVEVPIGPRDTAGELHDRLAAAGADAIVAALERLARDGALAAAPQPPRGVTYAAKVTRADAAIDWTKPAAAIDRQVRAFAPVPGAHATFRGQPLKIWTARPALTVAGAPPGAIAATGRDGIDVACGEGALRILVVQPAGGKRMPAAAFAAGRALAAGARFDSPSALR